MQIRTILKNSRHSRYRSAAHTEAKACFTTTATRERRKSRSDNVGAEASPHAPCSTGKAVARVGLKTHLFGVRKRRPTPRRLLFILVEFVRHAYIYVQFIPGFPSYPERLYQIPVYTFVVLRFYRFVSILRCCCCHQVY